MKPKIRRLTQGIALAIASSLMVLVILEATLPQLLPVTDKIEYQHLPKVGLHLKPNQTGKYLRDGIRGQFSINSAGFNNLRDYRNVSDRNVKRIAVVGDSFVEALQVDVREAFFSILETELQEAGIESEVLSFGVSGFGTSHVYHLVREYVLLYEPDLIIYLFIPNDISDSARCADTKDWGQQYRIGPTGELTAVPFDAYRLSTPKRLLMHSSMFRYFFYQRRLMEQVEIGKRRLGRETPEAPPPSGESPPSSEDPCTTEAWQIVEQLLGRLESLISDSGVPWILVWQGDADPGFHAKKRHRLLKIADRLGLTFFDLSPAFVRDSREYPDSHRIPGDGHWNSRGHSVVGEALASHPTIVRELRLDQKENRDSDSDTPPR